MKELRTCEIEGCDRIHYAKGHCRVHYYKQRRARNPQKVAISVGRRGRPDGHKLSQETKNKIAQSKVGHRHSIETKDKIAAGLVKYFKKKNPLSKELTRMYGDVAGDWIEENKEEIDAAEDVNTLIRMRAISRVEYPVGPAIEWMAINNVTPELLVLAKEAMEEEENKNKEGEEDD